MDALHKKIEAARACSGFIDLSQDTQDFILDQVEKQHQLDEIKAFEEQEKATCARIRATAPTITLNRKSVTQPNKIGSYADAPTLLDKQEIERLADDAVQLALFEMKSGAVVDERRISVRWQKRRIRQANQQDFDLWTSAAGLIKKGGNEVCHDFLVKARAWQIEGHKKFGSRTEMRCSDGKTVMLSQVMEQSRKCKQAELVTMLKGIQGHAETDGLKWMFVVITCPPEMHPAPAIGRRSYDGTSPAAAHRWLHDAWRGAVRRLENHNINLSGVRTTEYNLDGCPHWNLGLYYHPADEEKIIKEIRKQWKTEIAARIEIGDPARGSFSNYMFKYVMKSINTGGLYARYDAKRSIWNHRSFQFFGTPRISTWRAFWKQKECPSGEKLAAIWRAVRRGDGAAFIGLCGGLAVAQKSRPVQGKIETTPFPNQTKTIKLEAVDYETGEIQFQKTALPVWKRFSLLKRGLAVSENDPREACASNTPPPGLEYLIIEPPPPSNILHQK